MAGSAPGIEEPLEDQAVAQRVEIRYLQAVGNDRPGGAAAARAGSNAVLPGVSDQVPDDQEVGREAHLVDDP